MVTDIRYKVFDKPLEYGEMLALQEKTRDDVIAGVHDGIIYFLEHIPVYTSGLRGEDSQFLKFAENIPVFKIRRGGELTWHGHGQLVVYPVINIRKAGFSSIKEFVIFFGKTIENVLQNYCGIKNSLWQEEKAGVWVEDRKIAFTGLHFKKFVPVHGYSVNISNDMSFFSNIVPCGIVNCKITSVEFETGKKYIVSGFSKEIVKILKEKLPQLSEL